MLATLGHLVHQGPRLNPAPRSQATREPMAAVAPMPGSDAHFRSKSFGISRSRTLSPAAKNDAQCFQSLTNSGTFQRDQCPFVSINYKLRGEGGGMEAGGWRLEARGWTDEVRSTGTSELAPAIRNCRLSTVDCRPRSSPHPRPNWS